VIAIKANELRDNFKGICDLVVSGETVIVSRPHNQNVVVLSENEFNIREKAFRNSEHMAKIDESIKQLSNGKVVIKTMEELEEMEK
jgi:antitoxin YefM